MPKIKHIAVSTQDPAVSGFFLTGRAFSGIHHIGFQVDSLEETR